MATYNSPTYDPERCTPCKICKMMIRHKKMPYHILKCKKVHPDEPFEICPYNATHVVETHLFRHHKATCEDKGVVEKNLAQMALGDASTHKFVDVVIHSNENWDNDMTAPGFDLAVGDLSMNRQPAQSFNEQRGPRNRPLTVGGVGNGFTESRLPSGVTPETANRQAKLIMGRGLGRGGAQPQQEPAVGMVRGSQGAAAGLGRGRGLTTDQPTSSRPPRSLPQHLQPQQRSQAMTGIGRGVSSNPPPPSEPIRGLGRGLTPAFQQQLVNNTPGIGQQETHNRVSRERSSSIGDSPESSSMDTASDTASSSNSPAMRQSPAKTSSGSNSPLRAGRGRGRGRGLASPGSTASSSSVVNSANDAPMDYSDADKSAAMKEMRSLRKKLRAIESLEAKMHRGVQLSGAEVEKLGKKALMEGHLARLEAQYPS